MSIVALSAHTIDPNGETVYEKNPDGLYSGSSLVKLLTCQTAREWVALEDTVVIDGGLGGLIAGETYTYEDLFHAALLPSSNTAATMISRGVGQVILDSEEAAGNPETRFLTAMNDYADALGWSGYTFEDVSGVLGINSWSSRMVNDLTRHMRVDDPWLFEAAGKQQHVAHPMTSTGVYRDVTFTHTIDQTPFPEFVAGKTGTGDGANLMMAWEHPYDGGTYITTLMKSTTSGQRYVDMRTIIEEVVASTHGTQRRRAASVVGLI